MRSPSQASFRVAAFAFAAVLVVQAAWVCAAELVRPALPYFPDITAIAAGERSRAGMAASLGMVRGDLWADYAVTFANAISAELQGAAAGSVQTDQDALDAARRAARLSPHDARAWLVLAAAGARLGSPSRDIAGALKMSYYTGPGETALMPLRIRLSTRSALIEDDELQTLVTQDFRAIVIANSELKSDILAAYRQAAPAGKKFIESKLQQLDPALLRAAQERR